MPKNLVVICSASQQSLKLFLVIVYDLGKGQGITDGIKTYPRPCVVPVSGKALGNHLMGQRY